MKFRNKEGETKPQNTITVNEKGAGRGLMEDEREVPDGINPPLGILAAYCQSNLEQSSCLSQGITWERGERGWNRLWSGVSAD